MFDIYHTEPFYCICIFFATAWSFLHPTRHASVAAEFRIYDCLYSHHLFGWQYTNFVRRNWISITFVS